MAKRKTIKVVDIKAKANDYLKNSPNEAREARRVLGNFVSNLLLEADAYQGFQYLWEGQVPAGHTFGIEFDETEARAHKYPDDSRIYYF